MTQIKDLQIDITAKLEDLIAIIQLSGKLACALAYDGDIFINILTDGDIRRAILQKKTLDLKVKDVLYIKSVQKRSSLIFVNKGTDPEKIKTIFKKNNLRQLVIVDDGMPINVIHYEDINYLPGHLKSNFSVLIMAGGFGKRLMPLTQSLPKPMLSINGVPMLEIIIKQLSRLKIKKIYISVHYLSEKIIDYFGNGNSFGVDIEYINEKKPMGTGGCIRLIKKIDEELLIINGDILTQLDYEMFYGAHLKSKSVISVATTQYNYIVPFGVIEQKNLQITSLIEKPSYDFLVNAGIYFISPSVLENLPKSEFFNMTDVVNFHVELGNLVSCFPIFENWLDIGQPEDYKAAKNSSIK